MLWDISEVLYEQGCGGMCQGLRRRAFRLGLEEFIPHKDGRRLAGKDTA